MRAHLRENDLERLPASVIAPYDEGVPEELLAHAIFDG